LLAGVAIITAITLQRRQNVNPTPGQAANTYPGKKASNGQDANCRTKGTTCDDKAEFLGVTAGGLGINQMAYCRTLNTMDADGWRYGRWVPDAINKCADPNALCAGANRSGFISDGAGTKCTNPYRCPDASPTPQPTTGNVNVRAYCDGSIELNIPFVVTANGQNMTGTTPGQKDFQGTSVVDVYIADTPEVRSRYPQYPNITLSGGTQRTGVRAGDTVTFNFTNCGTTTTPGRTNTPTPTRPPATVRACIDSRFTDGAKDKTVTAGETIEFYADVQNPSGDWAKAVPFNLGNNNTAAKIPVTASASGYSQMAVDDAGPNAVRFLKTSTQVGSGTHRYYFKINTAQLYQTDANNGQVLKNINLHTYGGHYPNVNDGLCEVYLNIVPPVTQTPSNTPTATATSTATPTATRTPSACTSISVRNNRTNTTCDSNTNPTNCNIRQGDALTVTVNGSNTSQYRVQTSWTSTQSTFGTSSSTTVTVPTSALPNNSISLQGYVSNGEDSMTGDACKFTAQFTSTPDVTKTLDVAGSTALVNSSSDPVIVDQNSTVKYDISVKNTGTTGILHNVIVVDSLSAYDAAGNQIGTAFGNIIGADNLVRSVGTQSTPATVAPRVPSGNTYPTGNNVKSVEWNRINDLYYGETYTSKVTVDVLAGTTLLRNNVCMYEDSNNNNQFDYTDTNSNGRYDYGVDTPTDRVLDCHKVDVATAAPDYTVRKEAITATTNDAVRMVKPGDTFRYRVTLKNTHASNTLNLANVTITDTFDNTFLSKFDFTDLPTGANQTGNVITWPATADQSGGTLAPGASATYELTLSVKSTFFSGITNCTEAVVNNVKASSSSPNYTTPTYEVYVTVNNNPACAPTPIPPTSIPNTGIGTGNLIRIVGIALLAAAVALYVVTNRYKKTLYFTNSTPAASGSRNKNGLNDRLSDIVTRLKNK
jgi:uncharacterized repeat protein (TIGR01451 family)